MVYVGIVRILRHLKEDLAWATDIQLWIISNICYVKCIATKELKNKAVLSLFYMSTQASCIHIRHTYQAKHSCLCYIYHYVCLILMLFNTYYIIRIEAIYECIIVVVHPT